MLDYLYEWVRNIIIFIVLKTIITNLLGKSSYKKYVNLITGFILLILVITPLFQLFKIEDKLDYFFSANHLLDETKNMELTFEDVESSQSSTIIKEYKDKLKTQIISLLENENLYISYINIMIEEDSNNVNYGQIQSLDIIASYVRATESETEEKVDKISIDKITIGRTGGLKQEEEMQQEEKRKNILTPDEINAKKRLSDFYNLNTDNINISIQE